MSSREKSVIIRQDRIDGNFIMYSWVDDLMTCKDGMRMQKTLNLRHPNASCAAAHERLLYAIDEIRYLV